MMARIHLSKTGRGRAAGLAVVAGCALAALIAWALGSAVYRDGILADAAIAVLVSAVMVGLVACVYGLMRAAEGGGG